MCCRTCCKKEAIKCSVRGVGRPVEKYGVERYKKNSKKVCRQRGRKVSEMSDKPTCHDVGPCDYPLPYYWVVNSPTTYICSFYSTFQALLDSKVFYRG